MTLVVCMHLFSAQKNIFEGQTLQELPLSPTSSGALWCFPQTWLARPMPQQLAGGTWAAVLHRCLWSQRCSIQMWVLACQQTLPGGLPWSFLLSFSWFAQPPWNSCVGTHPRPSAPHPRPSAPMCLWLVRPRNYLCGTMSWCWKTSGSSWWFFNTVHDSAPNSLWTTNWPPISGPISKWMRQMHQPWQELLASWTCLLGPWEASPVTSSLKRSSSSAWWTARSHGMLLWPCWFVSPSLFRWQKVQATGLCLSWTSSSWRWCLHWLGLAEIWELLSLGFASTNPSTIRCFLSRSMQDMSCFGLCCHVATTGGSMGACSMAQLWIRSDKTFVDMTSADKTSEPAGEKPQAAESTEMTV